jgi:hypothetical protein
LHVFNPEEAPHIAQGIRQHLYLKVALPAALKPSQHPLAFVCPRAGPLATGSHGMTGGMASSLALAGIGCAVVEHSGIENAVREWAWLQAVGLTQD